MQPRFDKPAMNNLPRQVLGEIVSQYGPALLEDPRRCQALLRDKCPKYKSEINLLIIVQRLIIARELRRYIDSVPHELLVTQLVNTMYQEFAFDQSAAQWAVYSWAQALGLSVTEAEIEEAPEETTVSEKREPPIIVSPHAETETIARKKSGSDGTAKRAQTRKRRRTKSSPAVDSQSRVDRESIDTTITYEDISLRNRFAVWIKPAITRLKKFVGIHEVIALQALPASRTSQSAEVQLRLKHPLHEPPETAEWFKGELEEVTSYITAEEMRRPPLVLTGYEGFGGTSIVNWAITQAANRIAHTTRSSATTALFVIHSHIEDLNGEILLNIDKGLAQVKSPSWQQFDEHFSPLFDHFNSYPFHTPGDMTMESAEEDGLRVVGLTKPIEVTVPIGSRRNYKNVRTDRPKPKAEQIRTLLNALDHQITTKRDTSHSAGLPYRIVLVIDFLDEFRLLKAIETFRPPFKALRIIVILNKSSYDQHMNSSKGRLGLPLKIISFLPKFEENIAAKLCRYYFDIPDELFENKNVKTLIKALEFRCRGLPGNFAKIIDTLMDPAKSIITLNDETVKPWKRYKAAENCLQKNWQKILRGHVEQAALEDPQRSAPLRLFLYQASEKIINTCQGKSEVEVVHVCMSHAPQTLLT